MMAREGKYSQITLATDEDLERDFPDWFAFGFPVRPPGDRGDAEAAAFALRRGLTMPREIKLLPPDHPIFSGGVSFVFRSDLPAEQDESEDEDEGDED